MSEELHKEIEKLNQQIFSLNKIIEMLENQLKDYKDIINKLIIKGSDNK